MDSGIIDLVLVGEVDKALLKNLSIKKAENLIHRKISFLILSVKELKNLKGTLKTEEAIAL